MRPITCSISGGTPPFRWSVHASELPPGLTLSSTTGNAIAIEGTPTEKSISGYFLPYLKVTDSSAVPQPRIRSLRLNVYGPSDFDCSPAAGNVGRYYFSSCNGLPLDTWISAGQLPPGLTLTYEGISGTPTMPGTFTFEISAQLGMYPAPAHTYTIDIDSVSADITIRTVPGGCSFSADGVVYSSPHTFSWQVGSQHAISVASPQETGGTRFVFANWNDGGAMSHTITVPAQATTYTANFTLQYRLTTSVSPSDIGSLTISPTSADGYYDAGASVQLTATSSNSRYSFGYWSGSATGTDNPKTIIMSFPRNVTAHFWGAAFVPSRLPPVSSRRVRTKRSRGFPDD